MGDMSATLTSFLVNTKLITFVIVKIMDHQWLSEVFFSNHHLWCFYGLLQCSLANIISLKTMPLNHFSRLDLCIFKSWPNKIMKWVLIHVIVVIDVHSWIGLSGNDNVKQACKIPSIDHKNDRFLRFCN